MVHSLDFQPTGDRLPPQNVEAEEAILGGILLDPEAIGRVMETLNANAFYISAHQTIYRAAVALNSQGRPTDLMSVTAWLKDQGQLDKVGGQGRLAQLVDRTISAANIDQYAALVMDKYMRRQMIRIGGEIVQLGFETGEPLEQVLDQAEQKLFAITQDRPQQSLTSTADILIDTFADIEQRAEGMVLPGIPCGFYDLDAMTQGFQRSDLIIAAGRPSMGKCLSAEAQIVLADGSVATIAEIYQRRSASLLTLGTDWRFHLTAPSAYIDDGQKPVFRVTTRSGREVETTLTHPFLTIQGWRSLAELAVGQKIAVPRAMPIFGQETLPEHQVKLLAYLIGDGCLTGDSPQFTNHSPEVRADFVAAAAQFPGVAVEGEPPQEGEIPTFKVTGTDQNSLQSWLEDMGLWGKQTHEQELPGIIFRLARPQLALFLNRLFSTDGWTTVLASGQAQLGFGTVSAPLARQVQHLLLRFGVLTQLRRRLVNHQSDRRPTWQIDITDVPSTHTFIQEISILGQSEALAQVAEALTNRRYQSNRDLIPVAVWETLGEAKGKQSWTSLANNAGLQNTSNLQVGQRAFTREQLFSLATVLEHRELQNIARSDVYWDEIVAIAPQGLKQVYDLTIPETHNFVANDICVHNTSFVLNIARNIAAGQKLPVAIFSLEMSKQQLVYRLLSSEVAMETSRLRTGRIAQHEWESLGLAISVLSQYPVFIDDTPNISVIEMRSKARRLQAEQGGALGLIVIDYLQLMEGSSDNRVQELSKITRSLKGLARELNVPIIALSQLSRGVESRTNKRPMMSDLRECVTGDTLVWLADGRRVPIADLVGQTPDVLSMDASGNIILAKTDLIWQIGKKQIYELTTTSGKTIRATEKHRLYTLSGWQQIRELQTGTRLAVVDKKSSMKSMRVMNFIDNSRELGHDFTHTKLKKLVPLQLCWEEIISIQSSEIETVYDLTVPETASWIGNGIVSHNSGSIEQDADLIMMLYREEYYDPDTPDRGIAEVIITKHRNGPTGAVKLLFEPQFTRFRNLMQPQ